MFSLLLACFMNGSVIVFSHYIVKLPHSLRTVNRKRMVKWRWRRTGPKATEQKQRLLYGRWWWCPTHKIGLEENLPFLSSPSRLCSQLKSLKPLSAILGSYRVATVMVVPSPDALSLLTMTARGVNSPLGQAESNLPHLAMAPYMLVINVYSALGKILCTLCTEKHFTHSEQKIF